MKLMYKKTENGVDWETYTLDSEYTSGYYSSIIVDNDDKVHICLFFTTPSDNIHH